MKHVCQNKIIFIKKQSILFISEYHVQKFLFSLFYLPGLCHHYLRQTKLRTSLRKKPNNAF